MDEKELIDGIFKNVPEDLGRTVLSFMDIDRDSALFVQAERPGKRAMHGKLLETEGLRHH